MKNLLLVCHETPYRNSHTVEILEAGMVGAVFDFNVSLLFRGEGIWSLLPQQDAAALGRRTVGKVLSALPTYDVSAVYACSEAAAAAGLDHNRFVVPVTLLEPAAQGALIQQQDAVIGG